MKPDPEIYQRALARLDVAAQEAIFVKDRLPNIVDARQIGMHAIQHAETGHTIEEILNSLQTQS